jgi:hypothetical protein
MLFTAFISFDYLLSRWLHDRASIRLCRGNTPETLWKGLGRGDAVKIGEGESRNITIAANQVIDYILRNHPSSIRPLHSQSARPNQQCLPQALTAGTPTVKPAWRLRHLNEVLNQGRHRYLASRNRERESWVVIKAPEEVVESYSTLPWIVVFPLRIPEPQPR